MKKIHSLFTFIKWGFNFIITKTFNIKQKTREGTSLLEEDDSNLNFFKEKAQSEIQYLIEFLRENGKSNGSYKYFVKAPFEENDHTEHLWVDVASYINGIFYGALANVPNSIQSIKHGDFVEVNKLDVEDWILEDNVLLAKVGGFSQKYLRKNRIR